MCIQNSGPHSETVNTDTDIHNRHIDTHSHSSSSEIVIRERAQWGPWSCPGSVLLSLAQLLPCLGALAPSQEQGFHCLSVV